MREQHSSSRAGGTPITVAERPSGDKDEQRLRDIFARKLIHVNALEPSLRVLVYIALALLGVVIALVASRDLPQPEWTAQSNGGTAIHVPAVTFVCGCIIFLIAWSYLLAGALRAHWALRFALLLVATITLGQTPVTTVLATASVIATTRYSLTIFDLINFVAVGMQVVSIALLWVWAIWLTVTNPSVRAVAPPPFRLSEVLGCFGLLGLYCIASIISFLTFLPGGAGGVGLLLVSELSLQYLFIFALIPVVIFWASTDFAEWGRALSQRVMQTTRRPPWLLMVVACAAASAVLVNVWRFVGMTIIPVLLLMGVLAGLLALLARFANFGGTGEEEVSPAALLVGTILLFAYPLFSILAVPMSLALGLALNVRGNHKQSARTTEIGFFAVCIGLLLGVVVTATVMRFNPHVLLGEQAFIALAILGLAAMSVVRRRQRARDTRPFVLLFVLLGSLQFIDWMGDFYALRIDAHVLEALVLLLALVWDVATSGEVINHSTWRFPRHSRVLLYFGYTVMAATAILYLTSLHTQGLALPTADSLNDSHYAETGLYVLGLTLVTVSFISGWRRWWRHERRMSGAAEEHALTAT